MEVGIPASFSAADNGTTMDSKASKSPKSVNFEEDGETMEGRKKYLTAKYGSHQMALIRKRLRVEMWLLEEMSKLYGKTVPGAEPEKELELDELLDIEEDGRRRVFLKHFLSDAAAPADTVNKFIEELLVQAKRL